MNAILPIIPEITRNDNIINAIISYRPAFICVVFTLSTWVDPEISLFCTGFDCACLIVPRISRYVAFASGRYSALPFNEYSKFALFPASTKPDHVVEPLSNRRLSGILSSTATIAGLSPLFIISNSTFVRLALFKAFLTRLISVSYTHLRAHETRHDLVCRLLLEKKK